MDYRIRKVTPEDLDQVAGVEAQCFPAAEAAGKEVISQRIRAFPDSFFVACLPDGRVIGFINGCVSEEQTIRDEMFQSVKAHNPHGAFQSVFGLDVLKPWRFKGVAAALMKRLIEEAEKKGRKGVILTCKEELIPYYEKFGFHNHGISASVHGGAVWYDMVLEFQPGRN